MNNRKILTISCIALICGFVYFLFYQQKIVVLFPRNHTFQKNEIDILSKKNIMLYAWKQNCWKRESAEIISSNQEAITIHNMINRLLILFEEEELITQKLSISSCALSPSGLELYISFDRYPFNETDSTNQKYMFIESILKTLRENKCMAQQVMFLVHHKPIVDYHLDFDRPWPISGFM